VRFPPVGPGPARAGRLGLGALGLLAAAAAVLCLASAPAAGARATGRHGYFERGQDLMTKGDAGLGVRYVAVALAMSPGDFGIQTYFLALLDQDRFASDVALMEALHRILPAYPPVLERLARLYEGSGRHEAEAEALYEDWRTLRPDSAEAHAMAGEHYRFAGKDREALNAFSDYLGVVQESDYAVDRIAESAAKLAAAMAIAAAVGVAMRDNGR
jgi:tetratricopeptide (TPR) repeat protein